MSETVNMPLYQNVYDGRTLSQKDIEKHLVDGEKFIAWFLGQTEGVTGFRLTSQDISKISLKPDGFFAFTNYRFFSIYGPEYYPRTILYTTTLRNIIGYFMDEHISNKRSEKGKKRYEITINLLPDITKKIRLDEEEKATELMQLLSKIIVREVEV